MVDPNIPNLPANATADEIPFLTALKHAVEALSGQGRNTDMNKALRVSDLERLGIDVGKFLKTTGRDPYAIVSSSSGSLAMPDPPKNLVVTKGAYSHTLEWGNPASEIVSHIEVWGAKNSQNLSDAENIGIVSLTRGNRGKTAKFINSGIDPTADWTYWIRSFSYAQKYSEWHPSLVQGGLTVAGNESIAQTINEVLEVLKGGTPELHDPLRPYATDERCRDSGGRVYTSKVDGNLGNSPPHEKWKRTGILMQGDIDGVPTIAIDGNLLVDKSILANAIQAGQIKADHVDFNEVFVGLKLQSGNYIEGLSGYKFDNKTAKLWNMSMTIGSGSSGYGNLTDAPTTLRELDAEGVDELIASSDEAIYTWEGTEPLNLNTDHLGADEFLFDSDVEGGAIVQIEVPDGFTGIIEIMLNGEVLTTTSWDCGDLDDKVGKVIDLSEATDEVIDLGSIA